METLLRYDQERKQKLLITNIISALLLILFLYTAVTKLMDNESFRYTLSRSPLLAPVAGIIAWLLPVVELAIVVLLFIPTFQRWGLVASLILITFFTSYLAYMIAFTPNLPCSCGGVLAALSWKQHIFFNLVFILLSLTGIYLYNRNKNRRSSPPP